MVNMLQPHLTGGIFLFLLKGCASSYVTSSPEWSGFLGRSLSVVCRYDKGYVNYRKYWCKGDIWNLCEIVVKTTRGSEAEVKDGRTSIKDNHIRSEFTVRLDDLTKQDAGIYWCAIERTGSDYESRVNITVLSEPTTTATVTTGYVSSIFPTKMTEQHPRSSLLMIPLLLPLVFLLLVIFLVGALLMMCRLKKQQAGKVSGAIPLSTAPSSTGGNISRAAVKRKGRFPFRRAPHRTDQATNSTELEYSSVIATPALNSQPQVSTEGVAYATLNFPAQHEQVIYANV